MQGNVRQVCEFSLSNIVVGHVSSMRKKTAFVCCKLLAVINWIFLVF